MNFGEKYVNVSYTILIFLTLCNFEIFKIKNLKIYINICLDVYMYIFMGRGSIGFLSF